MCGGVEFRKRAQHCVGQANAPGRPSGQIILLQMAASWVGLAGDAA
jgi:hypothetical protein